VLSKPEDLPVAGTKRHGWVEELRTFRKNWNFRGPLTANFSTRRGGGGVGRTLEETPGACCHTHTCHEQGRKGGRLPDRCCIVAKSFAAIIVSLVQISIAPSVTFRANIDRGTYRLGSHDVVHAAAEGTLIRRAAGRAVF